MNIVIAGAARTPIGRLGGVLSQVPAPQLGAAAIRAALARAGVDPGLVDAVIMGNVLSAGVGQAPARQAGIAAGIPSRATALTVNRVCASGLTAVALAAQAIQAGEAQVVVAGGMESMSLAPHLVPRARAGIRLGDAVLVDSLLYDGLRCPFGDSSMGQYADALARKYGITRADQDRFALESHQKASGARTGLSATEMISVEAGGHRPVAGDEGIRSDTSLEALARLAPAFHPLGTVTAGNASQMSDGAAALVLLGEEAAGRLGVTPLARIRGHATCGIEPADLFEAPIHAVRLLLKKTGMALADFDLIEVNEAFAAQCLANGQVLGWDWGRVNIWGGAIALGHPIGASGARILTTLLHALHARGGSTGLAVLCHGGGGAVALAVERAS